MEWRALPRAISADATFSLCRSADAGAAVAESPIAPSAAPACEPWAVKQRANCLAVCRNLVSASPVLYNRARSEFCFAGRVRSRAATVGAVAQLGERLNG